MNTKSKLHKITIILAIVLILFNFMGPNLALANETKTLRQLVDEGLMEWDSNNEMYSTIYGQIVIKNHKLTNSTPEEVMEWAKRHQDEIQVMINNNGGFVAIDIPESAYEENGPVAEQTETAGDGTTQAADTGYFDKEAAAGMGIDSLLIVPTVGLITTAVDGVYKVFQNFVIGDSYNILETLPWAGNHIVVSKNSQEAIDLKLSESDLAEGESNRAIPIQLDELYDIPTMLLTPAAIFEGKVAALNGNFFDSGDAAELGGEEMSTVGQLKSVVSGWYVTLRNIAIVGLLSVLIYIGIRIIISTSSNDKAKYKQFFMDWVIALCLIFFMHYIMSFMMTITDSITEMLANGSGVSEEIYEPREVLVAFGNGSSSNGEYMYTSFAGVARMRLQYDGTATKLGYMVLYIAFVGYTVYFTFVYLKRILYLAFFTMIAPLVALTYPIDKMKDGKAQAFNFWLKEYVFYSMLQPLHLFLYTIFVKSAIQLASKNMIYAIVAMAFIVPAEKIVKSMFGIKGQTESALGGFVGATVASHMFSTMKQRQKPPKDGMPAGGDKKPRISSNPNAIKEDSLFGSPDGEAGALATGATVGALGTGVARTFKSSEQETSTDAIMRAQQEQAYQAQLRKANAEEQQRKALQKQKAEVVASQKQSVGKLPSSAALRDAPIGQRRKQLSNNIKSAFNKRFYAAGGAKGIGLGVLKAGAKAYATAAGAIGLGAVGLGMGMVGGDLNNAWQGLAAGAGVGAYLGSNSGKKLVNAVSDTYNGRNGIGALTSEILNGETESIRRSEERDYINNKSNIERIRSDHDEWDLNQIKDYARREYNMMYDSKNTDVDLADKALTLEDEYAKTYSAEEAHERAAAQLNGAKYYDAATFRNAKKRDEVRTAKVEQLMGQGYSQQKAIEEVNLHYKGIAKMLGVNNLPDLAIQQVQQNASQQPKNSKSSPSSSQQPKAPNSSTTNPTQRKINTSRAKRATNTTILQPTNSTNPTARTINTSKAHRGRKNNK